MRILQTCRFTRKRERLQDETIQMNLQGDILDHRMKEMTTAHPVSRIEKMLGQ